MPTILESMVALMLLTANQSSFATTTPGEYYEITEMRYDARENKTYTLFTRYLVQGQYDTIARHLHVETLEGKVSLEQQVETSKKNVDIPIVVVSGLK